MNNRIKKILDGTNIEDITKNIEGFLEELKQNKNREQDEKDIIKKAKNNLKILRKNNKTYIDNIQIYENENTIKAFLAEEIVNESKRIEIEEILEVLNKELKELYEDQDKEQLVSRKTIDKILEELEEEFKFISIIENLGMNLSFMLFNNSHYGDCKFVKYNILEGRDSSIHKYAMKETDEFSNVFMIVKQIGMFICYILEGEAKMIPDDFREATKKLKVKILDENYESGKNTEIFAEAFTAIFFRKRNIRNNIKIEENEDAKILLEYFEDKLSALYKDSQEKMEWEGNDQCPCGSGKKYKDCCKKKDIKYCYKDENTYTKEIKMDDEVVDSLFITEAQFKKMFGRPTGNDDFVIYGMLDNQMDREIRKMKLAEEIPNEYLYAYDRTGLLLSPYNYNKLSDMDIQEFKEAQEEYRRLMTEDISNSHGNILQVAEATNIYIKRVFEENIDEIMYVLIKYIKDTTQKIGIPEGFSIKTMEDLMVYSAYRAYTHLETLEEIVKEGFFENSLAVVRMLFEILVNVKVFREDKELFNEKILSLAAVEEGKYIRKSKFVVQDKKTGKEYYCKIKIDKFSEKAGPKYVELYETLYDELSGFIHLDTLTARKIFERRDNFLDIDEAYIAGIMGMAFVAQIILELSQFEENKKQTRNDLIYYGNNILKELIKALESIKLVDEKETYQVLIDTLKECKIDDSVNRERDIRNK